MVPISENHLFEYHIFVGVDLNLILLDSYNLIIISLFFITTYHLFEFIIDSFPETGRTYNL